MVRRSILFALALALFPRPVAAQPNVEQIEPSPISVVMVASRAQEQGSLQVIRALEAHLSDLPVVFHVTWVSDHDAEILGQRQVATREAARLGAVAVFWCQQLPADRLFFLLASEAGERVLLRDLGDESTSSEAIALIVRGAVSVFLEEPDAESVFVESTVWTEAETSPPRQEPQEDDQSPAEAVPPVSGVEERTVDRDRSRSRLTLFAAYQLLLWSRDDPVVSSLSIGVETRFSFGLMFSLGYLVTGPVSGQEQGVELDLIRFPIELGAGYRHIFGRTSLAGSLVIGVTPISKEVRADDSMEIVSSRAALDVTLRPTVTIDVRIVPNLHARFALGLEIPFDPVDYLIEVGSSTFTVLQSWAVRPFFMLGLSFGVL